MGPQAGPGWGGPPGPGWGPPPGPGWGPAGGYGYPPPTPGAELGYPPPPGYSYPPSGDAAAGSGNGKAVAGFTLGIAALLLFFFTLFDLIPIVLAFVFSIQGLQASRRGMGHRGLAVAGLVLASLATVAVVVFVAFAALRVQHCQQHYNQGTTAYNQCILHV